MVEDFIKFPFFYCVYRFAVWSREGERLETALSAFAQLGYMCWAFEFIYGSDVSLCFMLYSFCVVFLSEKFFPENHRLERVARESEREEKLQ